VYVLEDLLDELINRQFNVEEPTPVKITVRTESQVDKLLDTRVRRGIPEHLVRCRGYGPAFDS
jgi:hypothetical protein